MPSEIRVPEDTHDKQAALLATFLKRQAHSYLIPRLERHARTTQLFPASSSLTSQNLLGRVPQNHRHTLQLAAGRRTGIRCRLCLHTRTLPPRPSRPQPRLLGTDPPLRPLHAQSETVAQNPRQGTFRLRLTRTGPTRRFQTASVPEQARARPIQTAMTLCRRFGAGWRHTRRLPRFISHHSSETRNPPGPTCGMKRLS